MARIQSWYLAIRECKVGPCLSEASHALPNPGASELVDHQNQSGKSRLLISTLLCTSLIWNVLPPKKMHIGLQAMKAQYKQASLNEKKRLCPFQQEGSKSFNVCWRSLSNTLLVFKLQVGANGDLSKPKGANVGVRQPTQILLIPPSCSSPQHLTLQHSRGSPNTHEWIFKGMQGGGGKAPLCKQTSAYMSLDPTCGCKAPYTVWELLTHKQHLQNWENDWMV